MLSNASLIILLSFVSLSSGVMITSSKSESTTEINAAACLPSFLAIWNNANASPFQRKESMLWLRDCFLISLAVY